MRTIKIAAFLLLAAVPAFPGHAGVPPVPVPVERPPDSVIDQFLPALTGTEAAATAAVKKYCTADVIANGMIPIGKNPKIVKREGNCARFSLDDDGEKNYYDICEENGKINVFEFWVDDEE